MFGRTKYIFYNMKRKRNKLWSAAVLNGKTKSTDANGAPADNSVDNLQEKLFPIW